MGKFKFFPSNVSVVARVLSVEKKATIYQNSVVYYIMATQDCYEDPKYRDVPRICFGYNASTDGRKKFFESLRRGDVIECLGSIEGSVLNDKDNPIDIYEVFWQSINLVYRAS